MHPLTEQITNYFNQRGLVWPDDGDTALQFATTELGEALEILLARKADWLRNNPAGKPNFDKVQFGIECGDVVMMAIVAGIVEGVDPVEALLDKMHRKLGENGDSFQSRTKYE